MKNATGKNVASGGYSLIELAWGVALLGLVMGSVLLVGNAGTQAHNTGMVAHDVDARLRRTMNRIADELMPSGLQSLVPDPVDPEGDILLDFQTSAGVLSSRLQWNDMKRLVLEYEPGEVDNGVDDDGDELIDEGQVVLVRNVGDVDEIRTVLCRGVTEFLEGEADNDADDNGNGLVDERGFCITREGDRLVLRLTVVREERGQRIQRTIESSVLPRNTK